MVVQGGGETWQLGLPHLLFPSRDIDPCPADPVTILIININMVKNSYILYFQVQSIIWYQEDPVCRVNKVDASRPRWYSSSIIIITTRPKPARPSGRLTLRPWRSARADRKWSSFVTNKHCIIIYISSSHPKVKHPIHGVGKTLGLPFYCSRLVALRRE